MVRVPRPGLSQTMRKLRALTATSVLALVAALFTVVSVADAPAEAVPAYRILITGDSITQGSSGDYTWRYRLWNKLAGTAPGNVAFVGTRTDLYDVVNDAHGSQNYAVTSFSARAHSARWGDSFTQELGQIGGQVASTNANVLVVALGSNDLAYLTNPEQTTANLARYIQQARAARPGIDVVVSEVVNRWDPWAQTFQITQQVNDYAARIQTLAAQLNTASERVVVAATRTGWNAQTHTWDGTHPNPTGESLIAQRISEALAQIGIGAAAPNIAVGQAWNVAGPTPGATAGTESVALTWNRSPSGATGMFIETRLVNTGQAWNRLPYAVSGNGWNVDVLAAGGTYDFRLVPSKGFSTGVAGLSVTRTPGGPPLGSIASMVPVAQDIDSYGGRAVHTAWSQATNATGYKLSYRASVDPNIGNWVDLPYPVTGVGWRFELLNTGRYYDFRVRANRGFIDGPWVKTATATRTPGLPSNRVHVILGDSYSAGTGSSDQDNTSCARSGNAWPYKMQPSLTSAWLNYACAGAKRFDVPAQLSGVQTALSSYPTSPRLVTLTIGGNDIGFSPLIKSCVTGWNLCTNQWQDMITRISTIQGPLTGLYTSVKTAMPYADILVGGYPVPVQVDGRSGLFDNVACQGIENVERVMAKDLTTRLNNTITTAANNAGVWTVGNRVATQFEGHAACADNALNDWINAAQGLSDLEADIASFHPNDIGQLAYAIVFGNRLTDVAN